MEHPTMIIRPIHYRMVQAIDKVGSMNAFMLHIKNEDNVYPNRHIWGGLSYPTVRKLYQWNPALSGEFTVDTLYRLHLMTEDFLAQAED